MNTLDATRAELALLVLYLKKAEAREGNTIWFEICEQWRAWYSLRHQLHLQFVNDLHALISPPTKGTHLPIVLLGKFKNALLSTFLFLEQIVWLGRKNIY